MTKFEKEVKKQEILAHLENEVLEHAKAIAELASDAWVEIDNLYDGESPESFTETQKKVNKILRRYLGVV